MKFIYWDICRTVCLEKGCTLPKLLAYRDVQKNSYALQSVKRNFLKSSLIWCDNEMNSNDIQY